MRVILNEGLNGVTVRGIATATGWSTGSLRHYFANQHDLQAYTIETATRTLRNRVLQRVQRPRTSLSAVERVASIIEELLPLDDSRQDEYALWVAITEWERRHPPASGSVTWREQRALYRQCVALLRGEATTSNLNDAARIHQHAAVEQWAAVLHTFVDGLASQIVNTPAEISLQVAQDLTRLLLESVPTGKSP